MRASLLTLFVGLSVLVSGVPSFGHTVQYSIELSGPNESPPNASPGVGTGLVTVDLDLATMTLETTFSGLLGNVTASHIHCCTVDPGLLNAGVATPVPSFPDFPLGVTSGSYTKTFDLTLASSYNPAFVTAHGGTVSTALNDLLAGFDSGRAYLNIHTTLFQPGEIRGFLKMVPEPNTILLAVAALAIGMARRVRG